MGFLSRSDADAEEVAHAGGDGHGRSTPEQHTQRGGKLGRRTRMGADVLYVQGKGRPGKDSFVVLTPAAMVNRTLDPTSKSAAGMFKRSVVLP